MAKGNAVSKAFVWVLLALLIVGLAGFGVGGFGGSVRSIGKVGDQDIGTQDYARALQQEVRTLSQQFGTPVTFQQARSFGIDAAVRQRLVTAAALDDRATKIGVSAGDARLAAEIMKIPAFGGLTGNFDRESYRFSLEQAGYTEATFEARVRADIARSVLERGLSAGFTPPEVLARTLYDYVAERRSISVLRLTEADLPTPLPEADEAALRAFHAANPDRYVKPAARRITYAVLLPEALVDTIEIDEAALRAMYQARIADFVQPERRLVERLVYGTEADANAARNRLDAGTARFDDLVAERGLTLADIDLGDVAAPDLGAAAEAVFAAEAPSVVGPLPSSLGPALFRVNGVLAAEETTFEEARADLSAELASDAARRAIADRIDGIDDLLAGGATLEELADEPGIKIATVDLTPESRDGIAAYAEFRSRAAAVTEKDFPEVFVLADGGIAALRLDALVPAEPLAYAAVAETVATDARADALRAALTARAAEARAAVEAGGSLGQFGIVEVFAALTRDGFVEGAPETFLPQVFKLPEGGILQVAEGDFIALARTDAIMPADPTDAEGAPLIAAFARQAGQDMGADAFALFARAVENAAEIRLDEAAIAAVHAQIQ